MEAAPKRLDLWCLVLLVISAFATLVDSQQPDSTGISDALLQFYNLYYELTFVPLIISQFLYFCKTCMDSFNAIINR